MAQRRHLLAPVATNLATDAVTVDMDKAKLTKDTTSALRNIGVWKGQLFAVWYVSDDTTRASALELARMSLPDHWLAYTDFGALRVERDELSELLDKLS